MNNSTTVPASIAISEYQNVTWLPWLACSYADSLAIFRYMLTDSDVIDTPTISLQPDEIDRANRFHRAVDRTQFVIGRRLLRLLLAQYTNQPPNTIGIIAGKNRKPNLATDSRWHFNVSHSGNWVLVAVAQNAVGVDVEGLNPSFDYKAILSTSFTPMEQHYIQTHDAPSVAFYQLWTSKEALIKATGKGLDDDFSVIPSLTGLHQLGSNVLGAPGEWLVQRFAVTADCLAAVAYSASLETPKFYTVDSGFLAHFTS